MDYLLNYHNVRQSPGQGLCVVQCGYQQCLGAHAVPSKLYPHFSLTFILQGSGTYYSGEKSYKLHAGQGFLIMPGVLTSYIADSSDPWHYIYIIFYGNDCETLLHSAFLGDGNLTFDYCLDGDMKKLLFAMYECGHAVKTRGYDVMGYFYLIMSRLVADAAEYRKTDSTAETYLDRAIAYINDHYLYNISVQDIANAVCIDRTYLYKLFKTKFNRSPIQVLNDRRLVCAKNLLDSTDVTVSEIAWSSGFYDLSHFNRVFTGTFGITPGKYRKRPDK